jgi:hypothetical protein
MAAQESGEPGKLLALSPYYKMHRERVTDLL